MFQGHLYSAKIDKFDEIAQLAMLLLVACQTLEGSSDRTGNFLLDAVSELLRTAFLHSAGTLKLEDA